MIFIPLDIYSFNPKAVVMKLFIITSSIFLMMHTYAQQKDSIITTSAQVHVFKPETVPATTDQIKQLNIPKGFTISPFVTDLEKPRMMAVTTNGTVYVTQRNGKIIALRDDNNDGRADIIKTALTLKDAHGLAIDGNLLYIATIKEVFTAKINNDDSLGSPTKIIENLPDGGQHPNRTLAFGPDGKLYVSVGSDCNACTETTEEHATLLQFDKNGKNKKNFAKGLRNTIGFAWEPQTQKLYGLDHGIDWLGDDTQKEELNILEEGNHYGWPYIYENGKYNLADQPKDSSWQEFVKKTTNPVMLFTAHSAPMNLLFYKGDMFPSEYKGSAFLSFRGSWNRKEPSGYKLMTLEFNNGEAGDAKDFLTGFLFDNGKKYFGRPVGLIEMPDGALLFSDDTNGIIYRISYNQ